MTETQASAIESIEDIPTVCEFADNAAVIQWKDPADADCGAGSYLLVGPDDAPSPICGKHARILEDRLSSLSAHGVKLIPA